MFSQQIAVTFIGGRVGSSLTMGLLELSGIDVGAVDRRTSPQNPKGFYEITEYMHDLRKVYPNLDKFMPQNQFKAIDYQPDLNKWFTGDRIAIKAPYYKPVELFDSPIIIKLRRSIPAQAASIRKMNTKPGNFEDWLTKWYMWYEKQPAHLELGFEDWYYDPYKNYCKLASVIHPPKHLNKNEVESFVNKKYIHNGNNSTF